MTLLRRVRPASLTSFVAPFAPFALSALAGCAGHPPPSPVAPPPAAAVAAPAPPPPDLSAKPEPEGLAFFARANKPAAALKVIGGWVGMPMPGGDDVGSLVAGESIGDVIDLDQPIDFALVVKERAGSGAISAAVRSLDEAKAAFSKYKITPAENGALRIEGLGVPSSDEKDGEGGQARVCELVPSFGPATTRLVCGDSDAAVQALAPWLATGAPRLTFPSDLHVDVRFAPLRPTIEQMRRMLPLLVGKALGVRHRSFPQLDEAFHAAIDDLADFTSDCDTLTLDAMLGEPQGTVTITSQFRSTTSLLARLAVSHPERSAAPPAAFWKLPADADAAFFYPGIDAGDLERPRDRLSAVLTGGLEKEGFPEADRKAVRDVAAHTIDLLTLKSSYARGIDADAAQKALAAVKAVKDGDDAAREEASQRAATEMVGWMVIGLDTPASRLVALEKAWAAAWARPAVAKWIKGKITEAPAPTVKVTPAPASLGVKGASQLEIALYRPLPAPADAKKKPAPGKPIVVHAVVVPDGASSSWVVLAADPALAVTKAKEVLAGGAALASRPGLAAMKDARMTSGGFLSARSIAEGDVLGWILGQENLSRDVIGALASSPDRGTTPVLLESSAQAGGAGAPSGTFVSTVTVPKDAIASFVRLALLHH